MKKLVNVPWEWSELELTVGITMVGTSFRVRCQAKLDYQ